MKASFDLNINTVIVEPLEFVMLFQNKKCKCSRKIVFPITLTL